MPLGLTMELMLLLFSSGTSTPYGFLYPSFDSFSCSKYIDYRWCQVWDLCFTLKVLVTVKPLQMVLSPCQVFLVLTFICWMENIEFEHARVLDCKVKGFLDISSGKQCHLSALDMCSLSQPRTVSSWNPLTSEWLHSAGLTADITNKIWMDSKKVYLWMVSPFFDLSSSYWPCPKYV